MNEIDQTTDIVFHDRTVDQGNEFIATVPVHPVFQHRDAEEKFPQLDEKFIARIVTVIVIDGLETIQIEEQQIAIATVLNMIDEDRTVIDQFPAVWKAGQ